MPPAQRAGKDEEHEGQYRPDLAHDQHRTAAMPVGQASQPGSSQELGGKERGGQQRDLQDGATKLPLGIERQNGQDHASPQDVGKDDEQNRE